MHSMIKLLLLVEGKKNKNINEVVNCEWRAWVRLHTSGGCAKKTTTMTTSDSQKDVSISIHYLVIKTLLSASTFVEQCLVFIVFYKNKHLRRINNYYMLSLMCTDLLISILSMPFWTMFTTLGYCPLGHFTWDFWHGLDHALCAISIHTIAFISIERFRSIQHPLKFRTALKGRRTVLWLTAIWIFNIFFWIPFLFVTQRIYGSEEKIVAYRSITELAIFVALLAILIPVLVTAVFYVLIYRIANRPAQVPTANNTGNNSHGGHKRESDSSTPFHGDGTNTAETAKSQLPPSSLLKLYVNKKALQTTAILLVSFVICWIPLGIIIVLQGVLKDIKFQLWTTIAYWMAYTNSFFNPICFAISNKTFCNCMVKLLKCVFWSPLVQTIHVP